MTESKNTIDRLAQWAQQQPEKPALWMGQDDAPVTFRQLDEQAYRIAQWLVDLGLKPGDGIALLMENCTALLALAWGARRAGLYFTPVSTHLRPVEVAYLLSDCDARLLVTTPAMLPLVSQWEALVALGASAGEAGASVQACPRYVVGTSWEAVVNAVPTNTVLPERPVGRDFLYSSGTTGYPKGIKRPLTAYADRFKDPYDMRVWREVFGFSADTVYLSTAPLYHAAPLRYSMRTLEVGGTVVVMPQFDAEQALALIARHRVTHSQWVPTMLIRLLALAPEIRDSYKIDSMKMAIHAAAPCPTQVKRDIIAWWGPVLCEYYGGSEGVGLTALDSAAWLMHPGSVGRAVLGELHIKDERGEALPVGHQGMIYFSGTPRFKYHKDPTKTAKAYDAQGCATYGDIGHVDAEGYLYISGRRTDLILSGGVNIYPQEIENILATYPGVADVAVIGVQHPEFGEAVKAVVELKDAASACPALAQALLDHCYTHLARLKCPRSVDFVASLPRQENGKLYKRLLMNQYSAAAALNTPPSIL